MKSQIHEHKKNNVFTASKKLLVMAALVLGATAMVNAQEPAKTAVTKEVKEVKHHKRHKDGKKVDVTKTETKTEAKTVKPAAKK